MIHITYLVIPPHRESLEDQGSSPHWSLSLHVQGPPTHHLLNLPLLQAPTVAVTIRRRAAEFGIAPVISSLATPLPDGQPNTYIVWWVILLSLGVHSVLCLPKIHPP